MVHGDNSNDHAVSDEQAIIATLQAELNICNQDAKALREMICQKDDTIAELRQQILHIKKILDKNIISQKALKDEFSQACQEITDLKQQLWESKKQAQLAQLDIMLKEELARIISERSNDCQSRGAYKNMPLFEI